MSDPMRVLVKPPVGWMPVEMMPKVGVPVKRVPAAGNAPDAGSDEREGGFVAQAHEALDRVDGVTSNVGFGASVVDAGLKGASPRVGAVATGLGKVNAGLTLARAGVDVGRLLGDKEHWEKTAGEAGDGDMSAVDFALGAVDPGQVGTTVVRGAGLVGGVMDARRDAGEQEAMNRDQAQLEELRRLRKEARPFSYGFGTVDQEVPVVDPAHAREVEAAREAFGARVLHDQTMEMVRNVLGGVR